MKNLTNSFSGRSFLNIFLINIFFVALMATATFSALPNFSQAQVLQVNDSTKSRCEPGKLCNPIGSSTLSEFVKMITDIAVKIGVPIAALFIMWAGFKFVTARGDTKAIEDAKMIFWWTIIGTAILLGAQALSTVLSGTLTQLK